MAPDSKSVGSMRTLMLGMVEWVEKLPAPIFCEMFRSEIEEFYKELSTEDYCEGDGFEYEERYQRSLQAQMCQSAESTIKIYDFKVMNKNSNMEMEIKTKKRTLSGSSEENGAQYHCDMCEKKFSSSHALGRHKTCHRKITIGRSSLAAAKTNVEAVKAKRHVCNTHDKEFTIGLALDGHQRLQSQGVIGLPRKKRRWQRWEAKEKKWAWMLRMKMGIACWCRSKFATILGAFVVRILVEIRESTQ